jgi:hypothetical protein
VTVREIPTEVFRTEFQRAIPCDDKSCPTVLAGPTDPGLCEDCAGAFEQQGVATSDEQLTLGDEETAA